jgi:hypothetical protein
MTKGPSPHLLWEELACKDGTPYPQEWRAIRGRVLGITFERIRTTLGALTGKLRGISIGSGYRTPEHNASIGGAKDSMHLYGLAIDLHTPPRVKLETLIEAADKVLYTKSGDARVKVGGLFIYEWGVHVDRRDYLKRPMARGDFRQQKGQGDVNA